MSVWEMWKFNAGVTLVLVVVNLALFTLGVTPWTVLGLMCLAGSLFYCFWQGRAFGHRACGIGDTVRRSLDPQSPAYGQVDGRLAAQAWSVGQGVRGVLASALVPYGVGCLYIACSLLGITALAMPLRLASWVLATPFWPLVLPWYQTFDRLTGVVAAVLMISPFILPLCTFAGYMQGPKLWARSEKAMAEGRRRARARSRVARPKAPPKPPKPEI